MGFCIAPTQVGSLSLKLGKETIIKFFNDHTQNKDMKMKGVLLRWVPIGEGRDEKQEWKDY